MNKLRIAFDVDGVLLNFGQSLQEYLTRVYKWEPNFSYSDKQRFLMHRFDPEKVKSLGWDAIVQGFESHGLFSSLLPMPGVRLMKELIEHPSVEVQFITSLEERLHSDRLANLQLVVHPSITPAQLICVPPPESKRHALTAFAPHIFIEDSLDNLVDCFGAHQSVWIDLSERQGVYDTSKLHLHEITIAKSLEEALIVCKNALTVLHGDLLSGSVKQSLNGAEFEALVRKAKL